MLKIFKDLVIPMRISRRDRSHWIDKRSPILKKHKAHRLKLATELGPSAATYKFLDEPEVKVNVKKETRKLASLSETLPRYEKYDEKTIDNIQHGSIFFDPKFNPHLHEERNRVNPEEEPFSSIYIGNEQTEGGRQYTDVKDVTSPELWQFVERLARIRIAPEVRRRKKDEPIERLPSGFIPPPEEAPDLPYFVPRTRNHLLPVYYNLSSDPEDCYTLIRNVTGDLWKLEEDLRLHLSLDPSKGKILTSVKEPDEIVAFRGRHLHEIVDWLHQQGF